MKTTYVMRNGQLVEKPPKVKVPAFENLPSYIEEISRDRVDAMTWAMLHMCQPLPPPEPPYDFTWPSADLSEKLFSLNGVRLPAVRFR